MYFIQPSRQISSLEQVLDTLPSLQMITIEDIHRYDPTIIAIADVHDFFTVPMGFAYHCDCARK